LTLKSCTPEKPSLGSIITLLIASKCELVARHWISLLLSSLHNIFA